MDRPPTVSNRLPLPDHSTHAISRRPAAAARVFLTAVMCLLSLLVMFLGLIDQSALWLWVGFVCALISGIFLQLLISRREKNESESKRQGESA